MSKPVNNDPCCRHLKGAAKQWCENDIMQQPIVGDPKNIQGWEKFAKCRNDQVVHRLALTRFDRAMAYVQKTSAIVAKSYGIVAGAIVLLIGTFGAVMNAAARQHTVLLKTRHPKRTEKLPVAKWETLRGVKTVVVNTWKLNNMAQSVCNQKQNPKACVKNFKTLTWKKIREKAGKHPIVRINRAPNNIVRVEFVKVPLPLKRK